MFLFLETKLFVWLFLFISLFVCCLFVCLSVLFFLEIFLLSTLTGKKMIQTKLYNAANVKRALVYLGAEVPGPT